MKLDNFFNHLLAKNLMELLKSALEIPRIEDLDWKSQ